MVKANVSVLQMALTTMHPFLVYTELQLEFLQCYDRLYAMICFKLWNVRMQIFHVKRWKLLFRKLNVVNACVEWPSRMSVHVRPVCWLHVCIEKSLCKSGLTHSQKSACRFRSVIAFLEMIECKRLRDLGWMCQCFNIFKRLTFEIA